MARPPAGFTLLETLVALVVLGLLLVGLTQGNRFGLQAWQRQAETIAARDQLDAVDRTLRQLLTRITLSDGGKLGEIEFTSDLPEAVALTTRRADMRLLIDRNRLILRWAPHAHEVRLGPPEQPVDTVLIVGVERLDIAYRGDDGQDATGWQDAWSAAGLPKLIRLRLIFPDHDRRHWPAIMVAPLAARGL